jgi:hypothetical protein
VKNWFLENHSRSADERAAIDRLAASAEWLVGHAWRLDKTSGQLVLDAEIEAHGATYALVMYYPPTYPGTPPYIKPTERPERASFRSSVRRWHAVSAMGAGYMDAPSDRRASPGKRAQVAPSGKPAWRGRTTGKRSLPAPINHGAAGSR